MDTQKDRRGSYFCGLRWMACTENTIPISRAVKKLFKSTMSVQPAICFPLSRLPFSHGSPVGFHGPALCFSWLITIIFLAWSGSFPKDPLSTAFSTASFPGSVWLYLIPLNLHLCPSSWPPSSPSCWLDNVIELSISKTGVIFLPKMDSFFNSLFLSTDPRSSQASCL